MVFIDLWDRPSVMDLLAAHYQNDRFYRLIEQRWGQRAAVIMDHYAQFGIFPSDSAPWHGFCQYFSAEQMKLVEAAYLRVFEVHEWVKVPPLQIQVHGYPARKIRGVRLLRAGGDISNGLVISHQLPPRFCSAHPRTGEANY